jgi:hypothetical protein
VVNWNWKERGCENGIGTSRRGLRKGVGRGASGKWNLKKRIEENGTERSMLGKWNSNNRVEEREL